MRLKYILKKIDKYDYGEIALLLFMLLKTLKGVVEMNFKQINKPDMYVTSIVMLNIVWVFTDISNYKIYPINVLLVDTLVCFIFLFYFAKIKLNKIKDYKNYIKIGTASLLYSVIVSTETIVMADNVSYKVFLVSCFSCLIFGFFGLILSNSTYIED